MCWLAILSMVYGTLGPCFEVVSMLFWQTLDLLSVYMPIQPGEEVLVVLPLCQPGDPLAPGFKEQCFFDLPPRVLYADLILQLWLAISTLPDRQWWLLAVLSQCTMDESCQTAAGGSAARPVPSVEAGQLGFDVVYDHLVCRIQVLVAVEVKSGIK